MKRVAVLTSGGDAPGMNAAIRAVVRKSIYNKLEVYGIKRGFTGLINGEIVEMQLGSVADIVHRGGTILRTARSPEFLTKEGQEKAVKFLKEREIEGLIVIGGDGSFRGAQVLEQNGIPTIGIPGTIDNDINGTDYTIGFDTAVNNVTDAINKLRDTATSHERVYVVEVMGRTAGNIALMAGLAGGAESILIPEIPFTVSDVCERLHKGMDRGKLHSIIIVAEGAGSAIEVGKEIQEKTNLETRVTILGHLQRGGTPTAFDRIMASLMASKAVTLLQKKRSGQMVGWVDGSITSLSFEVAAQQKRYFPYKTYDLAKILSI